MEIDDNWLPWLKLQKDFEEDKQQAVSRAMTNNQREIDRAKQQTEEKCKKEYMEEMKKLAAKHKEAISQTKKKQWVGPSFPWHVQWFVHVFFPVSLLRFSECITFHSKV